MQTKREIIVTGDGSRTIHFPELNENYHSSHGALQEARHVFLRNGYDDFADRQEIAVFEVGLGTGLNAILTLQEADRNKIHTRYTGIEAFPVSDEELKALDYKELLDDEEVVSKYNNMHAGQWGEEFHLSPYFSISKIHSEIQNYLFPEEEFDLVYFDAFGPRVQEEMWKPELFEKLYRSMKMGGLLVTYCAKGQVKRDLKSVGFIVETVPGPPGKREMTRAWKK